MSYTREADFSRWQYEVARDPGSPAFVPLADHYRLRGRLDVARRICIRGLERQPDNVEGHFLLGRVYRDAGNLEGAADEWDIALRLDPAHVAARRSLGLLRIEQGNVAEATRHLRIAHENDPDDPRIRRALRYLEGASRKEYLPAAYWDAVGTHLQPFAERFAREARVRLVLFLDTSGRLLTRHGSTGDLDLSGFASLAAGIHAAAGEIARMLDQPRFEQLYQGRGDRQIFLGAVRAPFGEILLLTTFGEETNVGLVRTFYRRLLHELDASTWPTTRWTRQAGSLEASLAAGVARVEQNGPRPGEEDS